MKFDRWPVALLARLVVPAAVTALTGLVSAWPAPAFAQTGDAPAIERRLTLPGAPPAFEVPPGERILTGKDDLVILRRRQFFTLSATSDTRYSSNAFLSDANRQHDVAETASAGLGFETVIAERYTVGADLGYAIARNARFSELGYDSLSAALRGRIPFGGWTVDGGYRLAVTEQPGFDEHIVTQNTVYAALTRTIVIDRETAFYPSVSLARIWANPGDFTNISLSPAISAVHLLSRELMIGGNVGLIARLYDDFFEELTGHAREEAGVIAGLFIRWAPAPWISVVGRLGLGYLGSTINSVDYFEYGIAPSIRVEMKL